MYIERTNWYANWQGMSAEADETDGPGLADTRLLHDAKEGA